MGDLPHACLCLHILDLVELPLLGACQVEWSLCDSLTNFGGGGKTGNEDVVDVKTFHVVVYVDFGERIPFVGIDICLLEDQGKIEGNLGEAGRG